MIDSMQKAARNDLAITLLFIAVVNVTVYQLTWVYAGPITALCAIILTTMIIRRRGISWGDLGLRRPKSIWITLGQTVVTFIGTGVVLYIAYQFAGLYFEKMETTVSRFGDMEGNLPLYLWWVLLGWVCGGFFEEMLFRGFLLNRIETMFGQHWLSTTLAIVFQAAIFGLVHFYYQGAFGAVTIFAAACFIG
ncbi:MAG: CPBP family intramembrane metalloprotease, partial [Xanthomonadales bacterium]|nr:CPBP family intramembrane metalloprotease [Xanthomonadales bacterium]